MTPKRVTKSARTYLGMIVIAGLSACGDMRTPDTPAATKPIRIVGSSTVYPFSTKVAQEFRNKTGQAIVVEATGSGGGHKAFCDGIGPNSPDVVNSSRRQKPSEYELCKRNGVETIVEIKIGYDGIVLANAFESAPLDMDLRALFLGLAEQVPTSATDCTLVPNPHTNWQSINPDLPDFDIEVYGPPPTSGTRDAFVEIAMEGGARSIPCLAALDPVSFTRVAHTLREDGHWIDSGENDNALVQTLINTPSAIGVLGYSFLDQNVDKIRGAKIDGAEPTFENIASGVYPVARSLYVYVKGDKAKTVPGLKGFALEFISDEAAGSGGYLEKIGLVPLPDEQRADIRADIETLTGYTP